ncbi:methyltransferase domain-containing protein [Arthrobacter mobilis]|uniref:Arsenite methyltransferase n=1 Tax=Arthrobacter mobilis TaxID=2724944 RepID=A0A7X6HDV2_9MICC|nr:methyltransferase domain-containing protein [Arthrobacter mobilis]NKX54630.1 methyltransferase domain-containing protein [Arthrobacter mobilis]
MNDAIGTVRSGTDTAVDSGTQTVDRAELEAKVKEIYRRVAQEPRGRYHFEMGRALAERLGYPPQHLDAVPPGAVESFAGVGYFFDLARLSPGEAVLDLGCGSGMDLFIAAAAVGPEGRAVGLDMTQEQLQKAEALRAGFPAASFVFGHIEDLPFEDASFDCIISNGVINLSPDKAAVFREAARVLKPGGRLAIADIVSRRQLAQQIVCNADLWAACIGGAEQVDTYQQLMTGSGLRLDQMRRNDYGFLSGSAQAASGKYGVMSLSMLAFRD